MSDLLLNDTNWDLTIAQGDLVLVSGGDGIRQLLKQRLWTFYQEWFLDASIGLPYFQTIMIKNPNFEAVDAIFKKEILETPNVTELTEFTLDFDGPSRTLSLVFKANSTFGVIDFNEAVQS